jgi:hypothetical protein
VQMKLGVELTPVYNAISVCRGQHRGRFPRLRRRTHLIVEGRVNNDLPTWFNRDVMRVEDPRLSWRLPAGAHVPIRRPRRLIRSRRSKRQPRHLGIDTAREPPRLTVNGANDWFPTWSPMADSCSSCPIATEA